MAFQTVPIESFGGLRLDVDPQELGFSGAVDMLNVDLDRLGRLRTRNALYANNTVTGTGYHTVFGAGTNNGELLAVRRSGSNLHIDKCSYLGASSNIGNWAASATALAHSWAALGTASATNVYVTSLDTTTGYTLRKYDGTTLGTGTGKPGFVATMPRSNRLAQGFYFAAADSPSGADGTKSTVFFSDARAPDTYTSTNWVQLNPGDGEHIVGMVTFGNDLWVIKQTKAYVFYAEETDATGLPVFRYREVPLPEPMLAAPGTNYQQVVAGRDGVYISTRHGVFKTTGGPFVSVSGAIDRIFSNDFTVASSLLTTTVPEIAWAGGRLYVNYVNANSARRTLVYDTRGDYWLLSNVDVARYVDWPAATYPSGVDSRNLETWIAGADGYFYSLSQDRTADTNTAGSAAIAWSWTSGWSDLGSPAREKRIRWSRVTGTGTVTLTRLADYGTTDANAAALTLGTSPTAATTLHNVSWRGTLMATKLSGTGAVVIGGLSHDIQAVRPAGIRSA